MIKCLEKELRELNVNVHLKTGVKDVICDEGVFGKIILDNGSEVRGDALIIATGGISYAATGSTGDGYKFAKEVGHSIVKPEPSLVPLESDEDFIKELQGLSLKNVKASLYSEGKLIHEDFGEMLFTHFGVSGPIILSISSFIKEKHKKLKLVIDLKPALDDQQMDKRILRDFEEFKNKSFKNSLDKILPKKLIPVIINQSGINPDKKVNEITKPERNRLSDAIKGLEIEIKGRRSFKEAIITRGGVDVKDIDPSTMESKKIKGLYFAGEVIDIDALTGGYNLQLAWSTGYLAGISIK